jgi:dynein heavy chain
VVVEGEVESWLTDIETTMRETLQKLLYVALQHVQKASLKKSAMENWVKNTVGQLLITSGQIGWTAKCTTALSDAAKNKRAMRRLKSEWHEYLNKLAKYVRGDVPPIELLKLVSLITIEVHSRDVIDKLKAATKKAQGVNAFEWTSQLRFYFDKPQGEYGKCVVRQTNTSFLYGYEYQGNNGRLVITPLTDRCYMTLTTALHLCRGGAPQGPAGTGKTETVKDLGKGLGNFVVVFNCSPEMGVDSVGRNFSGLAQTGAWGCFDEFNRISVEVLSVVALQVASIMTAIRNQSKEFMFEGHNIHLEPTVGIFVTMNPVGAGYTGRLIADPVAEGLLPRETLRCLRGWEWPPLLASSGDATVEAKPWTPVKFSHIQAHIPAPAPTCAGEGPGAATCKKLSHDHKRCEKQRGCRWERGTTEKLLWRNEHAAGSPKTDVEKADQRIKN